jgi:spore coat polysaccharide biosynthesis protein SpsF
MRTIVVVQARMGSTRLRGKVLADLAGQPMVARVLERAEAIAGIDEVAIAVPDLAEDDALATVADGLGARVVRGSADDVLGRFVRAADATGADAIVRITADCPLLSPRVSSTVVAGFASAGVDYASNTLVRTWPRGLDTEVVTVDALRVADAEGTTAADREHVTTFVWSRPDRFRLEAVTDEVDRSARRWTVDLAEDLAFARAVYDELGPAFEVDDVFALLERRPEIAEINAAISQKPLS